MLGSLHAHSVGKRGAKRALLESTKGVTVEEISTFSVDVKCGPFDRRVECIKWHPRQIGVAVVATHSGDIMYWNTEDPTDQQSTCIVRGPGKAGSIQEMTFHPRDDSLLYTASVDQTVKSHHILPGGATQTNVFMDTFNRDHWFCSCDIQQSPSTALYVGDNLGFCYVFSLDGKLQQRFRMHKKKVQHLEFHALDNNMLISAGNDRTIAVWDVRKLTGLLDSVSDADPKRSKPGFALPVHSIPQPACINTVHASPVSGAKLLCTTQNSQVRIYDLNRDLGEPIVIEHPHRQYQHLTPIKATWHPLCEDLFVIGRYDETRSIDIFDVASQDVVAALDGGSQYVSPTISVLNAFSPDGSALLSASAHYAYVWRPPHLHKSASSAENDNASDVRGVLNAIRDAAGPSSNGRAARNARSRMEKKRMQSSLTSTRTNSGSSSTQTSSSSASSETVRAIASTPNHRTTASDADADADDGGRLQRRTEAEEEDSQGDRGERENEQREGIDMQQYSFAGRRVRSRRI